MSKRLFYIFTALATLPVFSTPLMLSMATEGYEFKKYFILFYPIYVVVAAFLAWQSYRMNRRTVAWVLLILMILTDVTIWKLVVM
ncbi:MAG: hypothetical protein UH625_02175 [Muribaculaceae bacterium]|nr:hypothetical protein [Muribaculaceae bacterium]